MQKVKLINATKSPLGLPGCPTIDPGGSIYVENFDEISQNKIVAKWLDRGFLEVGGDEEVAEEVEQPEDTGSDVDPETDGTEETETGDDDAESSDENSEADSDESESDDGESEENTAEESDEDAEKEELIAALRNHGINRDKRTSLKKLRDLLEEAQAE